MPRIPSYRKRKDRNQALVTLTDAVTKRRRDYWLGEYGTPASRERYHRLIAEWEANGRRLPDPEPSVSAGRCLDGPTISEVIERRLGAGHVTTILASTSRCSAPS